MKLIKHCVFFLLILSVIMLSGTVSASIIKADFAWVGDKGYKVKGVLTYDDDYEVVSAFLGDNPKVVGIQSLEVSFSDRSSSLLARYDNILNGIIQYEFLRVKVDTVNRKFLDILDIGWEASDTLSPAYNLFAFVDGPNKEAWLDRSVWIEPPASKSLSSSSAALQNPLYQNLDNGDPTISVSVPEPGVISLMLLGLAGIAYQTRYRNKTLDKA